MSRVRYRQGIAGETRRVVHVAWTTGTTVQALCGAELLLAEAEVINDGGMPCMQCTARTALAAAERERGVTGPPSAGIFDE